MAHSFGYERSARRTALKFFMLIFANLVFCGWLASPNKSPQVRETKIEKGFSIEILDGGENSNPSIEQVVCYRVIQTSTNAQRVYLPKDIKFLCEIELLDKKGKAVPKTSLGKTIGSDFRKVKYSTNLLSAKAFSADLKLKMEDAFPKESRSSANILCRPIDLFYVDKPDIYTLRIRFQMFAYFGNGLFRLIRFDPVDYPVVK